jgi:hypothetical protein
VCAIDCEYLEMFALGVAHPAGDIRRFTIQLMRDRVTVRRQTRLAGGELIDWAQRNQAIVAGLSPPGDGRKNIPHDWYTKEHTCDSVEQQRDFQQHLTPGKSAGYTHSKSP